jgi:hypothetical protein
MGSSRWVRLWRVPVSVLSPSLCGSLWGNLQHHLVEPPGSKIVAILSFLDRTKDSVL